jgi:uncharacterized membrane protein YkvA (DUF1232 family)
MARRESSRSTPSPSFLAALLKNLRLAWRLLRDPLEPTWVKLIPFAALAYIILPFDFISDWIVGLGQVDDLTVFVLGLKLFFDLSPAGVIQRHQARMDSIDASYRIVEEVPPPVADPAGYLDAESHALPEHTSSADAEAQKTSPGEITDASAGDDL